MLPVTIAAGETTYATRRRPREWRILLFQILEAAKLPNAKPLSGDQNTLITYQAVDRYARDGSLWFGLKAVTYNSADVFPPEPLLTAKVPSEFAAIVAENSLSEQLNHATSAEHGSDLDSVRMWHHAEKMRQHTGWIRQCRRTYVRTVWSSSPDGA